MEMQDLSGSTEYEFQVRAVYEEMEGQYGEISDPIATKITLARELKSFAERSNISEDGKPERYKVPLKEDSKSINTEAKFRKCICGSYNPNFQDEKTIMLVGATGAGKSTLIDGMINYILNVTWDDEFRYTLINVTRDEQEECGNQAVSQTKWITNYVIYCLDGSKINYTLNIIDTPGFGDTRGIKRDKEIIEQLRKLFNMTGNRGVTTIDAVCFVTQAPLARLSPTQKYIFDNILSIFGQDIEENIFALITFADGDTPPVLSALKAAEVPFKKHFVFNNSALFAKKQNMASWFWQMGMTSFKIFFDHLKEVKKKSLLLTAEVLSEREKLETKVQGLQPQINLGLSKLEELRKTRKILEENKDKIKAHKNFEYETKETRQIKEDLTTGEHVTNCLTCNSTCHYPCYIPKDEDKSRCAAMSDGNCTVCPGKCYWRDHCNNQYRFIVYEVKVMKTYKNIKKKYEKGKKEEQTLKQILESMKKECNLSRKNVGKMLEDVGKSITRLREISLRPNPLSNVGYIDLLIETEKQDAKPGFIDRLAMLQNLRRDAVIMEKGKSFDPWGDIDIDDFIELDQSKDVGIKERVQNRLKYIFKHMK